MVDPDLAVFSHSGAVAPSALEARPASSSPPGGQPDPGVLYANVYRDPYGVVWVGRLRVKRFAAMLVPKIMFGVGDATIYRLVIRPKVRS